MIPGGCSGSRLAPSTTATTAGTSSGERRDVIDPGTTMSGLGALERPLTIVLSERHSRDRAATVPRRAALHALYVCAALLEQTVGTMETNDVSAIRATEGIAVHQLSFLFGAGFLLAVLAVPVVDASSVAAAGGSATTPTVTLPIIVRTPGTTTGPTTETVPTPIAPTPTTPVVSTPTVTGTTITTAPPMPFAGSATVSLSSLRTGARPVALTLTLAFEMQCGYPGPGPVLIEFPRQQRLPATLTRSQVLVDGRSARSVGINGRTVSIGLAPLPRIICMEISMGRLAITFTAAADLGNPVTAGTYTLAVTRASSTFEVPFTIRP